MISSKLLEDVTHESLLYILPFDCGYFANDEAPEKSDMVTLKASMALTAVNMYTNPYADAQPPIN